LYNDKLDRPAQHLEEEAVEVSVLTLFLFFFKKMFVDEIYRYYFFKKM
jgi:hypothetical protein